MFKKIYQELVAIKIELQAIRKGLDLDIPDENYKCVRKDGRTVRIKVQSGQ